MRILRTRLIQGLCKRTALALSSLATEENVTDVINLYHEFFTSAQDGEAASFVDDGEVRVKFGSADNGADPGVEFESSMTPDQLCFNLGFKNGLPLLFNNLRHRNGLSPWTHSDHFDVEKNPSAKGNLEPLRLHWHQLAGVHAIVRMNFQPKPSDNSCSGALIADEVGLGKTFQASTIIVFLADLVMRQSQKLPLPPMTRSSLFFYSIPTA